MVTPGCKHFSHSLTADAFTALENIVLSTTELHHTANATHNHAKPVRQMEDKIRFLNMYSHHIMNVQMYNTKEQYNYITVQFKRTVPQRENSVIVLHLF